MATTEEFKVNGEDLVAAIKRIIAAGNARRIIIKKENGESLVEFPLTFGAVGALIAPMLAAVGAIAALVTRCTIVVEKRDPSVSATEPPYNATDPSYTSASRGTTPDPRTNPEAKVPESEAFHGQGDAGDYTGGQSGPESAT